MRMREKLTNYTFHIEWVEGKNHLIADALSRAPVFTAEEFAMQADTAIHCLQAKSSESLADIGLKRDEGYLQLLAAVRSGKDFASLPPCHAARKYKSISDQISITSLDGSDIAMLDGSRIIVPQPAQRKVLQELHRSHSGHTKTLKTARQLYFWPGMKSDIIHEIDNCKVCREDLPTQARPTCTSTPASTAQAPMQHVASDLFDSQGHTWLVLVDRYSGYAWTSKLRSTTTSSVTTILSGWFDDYGWPTSIRTDGGPQYRTEFSDFCSNYGIKHELSSAYNPESNGLAESAVKSMKSLVSRCSRAGQPLHQAIAAWRNMAREDGYSPAQLFFGRRQRQRLPCTPSHCLLETPHMEARDELAKQQTAARNERTKDYTQLQLGDRAWLQNPVSGKWDTQVEIDSVRPEGHSYTVRTPEGKLYTRGRRLLRPLKAEKSGDSDIQSNPAARDTTPVALTPVLKKPSPPLRVQPPRLVKNNSVMTGRRNFETSNLAQPSDNFTVLEHCRRIYTSNRHVQAGSAPWNSPQQHRNRQPAGKQQPLDQNDVLGIPHRGTQRGGLIGELVDNWNLGDLLPPDASLVHETIRIYQRPVAERHASGISTQDEGGEQKGGPQASGVRPRRGFISPWLPWAAPADRPWRSNLRHASSPSRIDTTPGPPSSDTPARRKRKRGGRKHKKAPARACESTPPAHPTSVGRDDSNGSSDARETVGSTSDSRQHRAVDGEAEDDPAAVKSPTTIFIDLTSTDSEDEEPPRGPAIRQLIGERPEFNKGEPEKPPIKSRICGHPGDRTSPITTGGIYEVRTTAAEVYAEHISRYEEEVAGENVDPSAHTHEIKRVSNYGVGPHYPGGACAYPEEPTAFSTPRAATGSGGSQGSGTSSTASATSLAHHQVQIETGDESSRSTDSAEEPVEVLIRQDGDQIKRLISDLTTRLGECTRRPEDPSNQSRELLHFNTSLGHRRFPLSGPPAWPGIRDNPRVRQRRLERAAALEKEATRLRESVSLPLGDDSPVISEASNRSLEYQPQSAGNRSGQKTMRPS